MKLSLALGAAVVLVAGSVYLALLREPGALFYPFAIVVFIAGPLLAAVTAARQRRSNKRRAFLAAGSAVFGLATLLFAVSYVVYPQLARTSVSLPAFCGAFDGGPHPPASLAYDLPGVGATTRLTSNDHIAVVAAIDFTHAPYPSTVYLVQKGDGRVLGSLGFPNDSLSAAIDGGTLYLYNDKLGFLIDARTGAQITSFMIIDNYGGLSSTDRPVFAPGRATGRWYMETTAIISSWRVDGTVVSRARPVFNSIAFSCFITGQTGVVTEL
jgi:hypothetical protein